MWDLVSNGLSFLFMKDCGCQGKVFCKTKLGYVSATVSAGIAYVVNIPTKLYKWAFSSNEVGEITEEPNLEYHAVTNYDDLEPVHVNSKCFVGTGEAEHIALRGEGEHHVFGGGGLDVFTASEAVDVFYFSMCSTKIIDGKVATIYWFNPEQDRIELFCTMKPVEESDVNVYTIASENMTYIEIAGKFEQTAIAVEGLHPELTEVTSFNNKYADVAGRTCDTEESEFINA